jgi:3-methyl-2-oxobutanoate hydroxymethyltransferase
MSSGTGSPEGSPPAGASDRPYGGAEPGSAKVTTEQLRRMKARGEPIAVLTAYDYTSALLMDAAGIDVILVGDSMGTVVQGHDTTLPVTMDQVVYHTRCVVRGVKRAMVVADMPFLSFQVSGEEALRNAGRLLQEGGAEAVKIEGGVPVYETVRRLTSIGIPVMGHLGLTPQSIHQFGTYRTRGKDPGEARRIVADAKALGEGGAFALVLEKIPAALATEVTRSVAIPTIGIGAGPGCDGQVLVSHDMLGLFEKFRPRFVRRYAELGQAMRDAFVRYRDDVKARTFPDQRETY